MTDWWKRMSEKWCPVWEAMVFVVVLFGTLLIFAYLSYQPN